MTLNRQRLRELLAWARDSWATRSLAVGAVATALDVVVLLTCVRSFHLANPVGAMVGSTTGSVLTFFANRHFAFRDHDPKLGPQAVKFIVATALGIAAQAACVHVLADRVGVPVVIAKFLSDLAVFTVGQLLLLRYVVFPKKEAAEQEPLVAGGLPVLRGPASSRRTATAPPHVRAARPRRSRRLLP